MSNKTKSIPALSGKAPRPPAPAVAVEPDEHAVKHRVRSVVILHVVQAVLVLTGLIYALHLNTANLRIPFTFFGDTHAVLTNITALLHTGWFWQNPLLSAPFSYPNIALPANPSADFVLVWILARFSSDPGLILNLTWLAFFFMGAAIAFYCARHIEISPGIAMACGTVYAFLPFAFYRHTSHLILSYYLVPFACSLALVVATSASVARRFRLVCLAGCALLGFNYLYNAFFSVVILALALLIAILNRRPLASLKLAVTAITLICAAIALNLAPSLIHWRIHGKPFEQSKSVADTEHYGLKIRHLISPVTGYTSGPFHAWAQEEQEAAFPLENENATARLGIVPAAGFLLLIAALLASLPGLRKQSEYFKAAAQLNICILLIASVGGLAGLWSMFISPDIRAWNRMVVFIAFFAVCAIGWSVSFLQTRLRHAYRAAPAAIIVTVAILDQSHAAAGIVNRRPVDVQAALSTRDAVARIERIACRNCMVYQLPDRPFPVDPGEGQMGVYEHARPHIYSRTLRWSWPAFSQQRKAWQTGVSPEIRVALPYLRTSGFALIWLDRRGYAGKSSPETELTKLVGNPVFTSLDNNIAVFDIRQSGVDGNSSAAVRERERLLSAPAVLWGEGFYSEEIAGNQHVFRWSQPRSMLRVRNMTNEQGRYEMTFFAQSTDSTPRSLLVDVGGQQFPQKISAASEMVRIPVTLAPRETVDVRFSYDGPLLSTPPGDSRRLAFAVGELQVR